MTGGAAAGGAPTVGALVARVLGAAGVDGVYGTPYPGLPVVPVDDVAVATLMADAHRRVHGRPAVVHHGGGAFTRPDDPAPPTVVEAPADLVEVALPFRVALDPGAPAPDLLPVPGPPADGWIEPDEATVDAVRSAARPVVLCGPGVVHAGAVPGLHALASTAGLGVLNTWGAKGVFHWRSPHHLATAGLQARDFELGGLAGADLIVATGVDPAESGGDRWRLAPVVEVAPEALDPLAGRWSRAPRAIDVPPLRAGLARVTQEGWAPHAPPLAPTAVTRTYGEVVAAGGLVAADPGTAGYWVARTLPTTRLGGVQVPAGAGAHGLAVACCLVARLRSPLRPVLAVVDGPLDDRVRATLEVASRLGVAVPVEVWRGDGPAPSAEAHHDRLRAALVAVAPEPWALATAPSQMAQMVDVAGPVVAWEGGRDDA